MVCVGKWGFGKGLERGRERARHILRESYLGREHRQGKDSKEQTAYGCVKHSAYFVPLSLPHPHLLVHTKMGKIFAKVFSMPMKSHNCSIKKISLYILCIFLYLKKSIICLGKNENTNDNSNRSNGSINQNSAILSVGTQCCRWVWMQTCKLISIAVKSSAQDVFLKVEHLSNCVYVQRSGI